MIAPVYSDFLTKELRTADVQHSGRDLYTHLSQTYELLASWDSRPHVQLAGLFHSVYGTQIFRHSSLPFTQRAIVQNLIGAEAESLAYLFCVTRRPAALIKALPYERSRLFDQIKSQWIDISRETLNELIEIEIANLIEQGGRIARVLEELSHGSLRPPVRGAISQQIRPDAKVQ